MHSCLISWYCSWLLDAREIEASFDFRILISRWIAFHQAVIAKSYTILACMYYALKLDFLILLVAPGCFCNWVQTQASYDFRILILQLVTFLQAVSAKSYPVLALSLLWVASGHIIFNPNLGQLSFGLCYSKRTWIDLPMNRLPLNSDCSKPPPLPQLPAPK